MTETQGILQAGEQMFLHFVKQIEESKTSEISIRRALKKYDVKNLKINNVTPLRAKKMYSAIIPKYENGLAADKSWLENERRVFVWCALCYLHTHSLEVNEMVPFEIKEKEKDFEFLRSLFPEKELELIKFQVYSLVKKDNKNSGWNAEEDAYLKQLVEKEDPKSLEWSNISKEFFVLSQEEYFRNAKQCRERWLNHLDPNKTKGKWEQSQDIILLTEVLEKGKKWSKIVESLEGKKNEHMIKNRFKSLLHKKEKVCKNKKLKENDLIKLILKEYEGKNFKNKEESIEKHSSDVSEEPESENEEEELESEKEEAAELENIKWNSVREQNEKHEKYKKEPVEKIEETERENVIEVCGSKVDKEFISNLFFNVNTPIADNNQIQSIMLETRSPAGNLFMSPFPAGCWTPTIFLLDDTHGHGSPQLPLDSFSNTVKNAFHHFIGEDGESKN